MNHKLDMILDRAICDVCNELASNGGCSVYQVMLSAAYFTDGLLRSLPPDHMAIMHEDFMKLTPTERTRVAMELMARLDGDLQRSSEVSPCH